MLSARLRSSAPACVGVMTLQTWGQALGTGLGPLLTAHTGAALACTGLGDPRPRMAHVCLLPRRVLWVGCGHSSAVPPAAQAPRALHPQAHMAQIHVEDALEELSCWVSPSSPVARQWRGGGLREPAGCLALCWMASGCCRQQAPMHCVGVRE